MTEAGQQSEVDQLWDQLRQKDAQILMLQKKLQHFRTWVSSIHQRVQQMNPQAIKNSRRLYIGGIPPETSEDELRQFITSLMMKTGACTSPGSSIISCKITPEKNYAFVEFRSVEETSNAMAFDGVSFNDTFLKIRRPSNYDINTAIMLGPIHPDPTMDTSTLEICRTVVEDSPHKLFIGGLPCDWTEDQVKDLLVPYGMLKSFNLVMDKMTGKSKGYAFCEYAEDNLTEYVIKCLNGKKLGNKVLTVKRALEGGKQGTGPLPYGARGVSSFPQGPSIGANSPGAGNLGNVFSPGQQNTNTGNAVYSSKGGGPASAAGVFPSSPAGGNFPNSNSGMKNAAGNVQGGGGNNGSNYSSSPIGNNAVQANSNSGNINNGMNGFGVGLW